MQFNMTTVQIIEQATPGMAWGVSNDGNRILVSGGDIFLNKQCEVILRDGFAVPAKLNYELPLLQKKFGDKDGLIPFCVLKEYENSSEKRRIFELDNHICLPSENCSNLLSIAYELDFEKKSRIEITRSTGGVRCAAMIYGIDFEKALKKCLQNGIVKSYLYCPVRRAIEDGFFADFLIRLTRNKSKQVELNAWQVIDKDTRLYYVHGIILEDGSGFLHLDFAYHNTTREYIEKLLANIKENPVLSHKQKIFRVDDSSGKIGFSLAFALMKNFFPLDHLVDEYRTKEITA